MFSTLALLRWLPGFQACVLTTVNCYLLFNAGFSTLALLRLISGFLPILHLYAPYANLWNLAKNTVIPTTAVLLCTTTLTKMRSPCAKPSSNVVTRATTLHILKCFTTSSNALNL